MFVFKRLECRWEDNIRVDSKEIGCGRIDISKLLRAGYSGEPLRTK
jgi:hypothetical protein